jgi:surface polysaccharide O-acyltransferase-like enzyme
VIGPFADVQYQDGLLYILYPWFMVLLFVVSGMSARYYLNGHTHKEFIRTRTRKLLVPSTIGLFVIGWLQGYINMAISDAFVNIPDIVPKPVLYLIMVLSGVGVLWFVQMLWLFSLLLVLVRKIEKDRLYRVCGKANSLVLILLVIPVWGAAQILNTPLVTVYRFGIYGLCFFLGYFIFSHDAVIEKLSRFWLPLLILAVILAGAYTYYYFGENYAVAPVVKSVFSVIYAWFASLAILAVMKRWGDRTSRVAAYMSQRSFGLYVFHYLALSSIAYLLNRYTALPALLSYLIVIVAGFAGGILLYEVISRIPVIRWCVLGIKKQRK